MSGPCSFKFQNNSRLLFLFFFLTAFLPQAHSEDQTKKNTTQQIGGLLFDVDEGVKVEQGPGGSVYVKSNREYMQEKFDSIESRLADIESRLDKIEGKKNKTNASKAADDSEERKVLVTS